MGITKTELFTDSQNRLADWARVLGHPARIAILEYLLRQEQCINTHLVQELGLSQATISQHLRELKQLDILQGTIDGVRMNYCINRERWEEISAAFSQFFNRLPNPTPPDETCC